jgi:crotonobetainyl-CoA:carnitine CoA-transferase CaiB-like acyl-CoA transferase
MAFEAEQDGRTWTHLGVLVHLAAAPGTPDRLPPPRLGEHTEEVLAEAGIDAPAVRALRASGVV